jgi:hypothetical protein
MGATIVALDVLGLQLELASTSTRLSLAVQPPRLARRGRDPDPA